MNQVVSFPVKNLWPLLSRRPTLNINELQKTVESILNSVKLLGDQALFKYTKEFDKVVLSEFEVKNSDLENASLKVEVKLKEAINLAAKNIEKFHKAQHVELGSRIETSKGVMCWRRDTAIEKIGLYIPGGATPLFSTVLMLGIPAKLAGCKEIYLCTPPNLNGEVDPLILYTANLLGIKNVYKIGGAQAIAAMTFGTETIKKVDKIFGPGNQYVTMAKSLAQFNGVSIDMPAGPSEILIIADRNSNPKYVASDLLSQSEHGPDSHLVLLSDDKVLIDNVRREINIQKVNLPRIEYVNLVLAKGQFILFKNINECIDFSNQYAPEHLVLALSNAEFYTQEIINAGSVFLGKYSCESIGDYASGPNHTLPTNGFSKSYSGVSVDSFIKKITFQKVSKEGLLNIGGAVELMAEAEQLFAHKQAISLRLKDLNNV